MMSVRPIADSRLMIIPKAGHNLLITSAEQVGEYVMDFLGVG